MIFSWLCPFLGIFSLAFFCPFSGKKAKEIAGQFSGGKLQAFLVEQSSRETALPWLEPYFAGHRFLQVSDAFDETYRMIIDPGNQSVTLFCVDPSKRLAQTLKGLRTAVLFSATLSPLDYFIDVLGGSAKSSKGCYTSPFRSDQMTVRVAPLNISFSGAGQIDGLSRRGHPTTSS